MNNKQRIEFIEKAIGNDLSQLPGGIGMMLKTVVLPQLKSVPDSEQHKVREAVGHIIEVLTRAFDL